MSNVKPQDSQITRPSKKLVHLSLQWLFFGMGFLALGVLYVMKCYEAAAANTLEHLLWLALAMKHLPLELILLGSVIPIMLLGFFLAKWVGMPVAKRLTLMLMHRRLCKKTYALLLLSPLASLGLFLLPFVDLGYVLGLTLGITYVNCGFIFMKFSAALKAYVER